MNKTRIEWVRNPDGTQGYTWNPITGCLNGCEYCYARKLANGRLGSRYLANKAVSPYQGEVDYMNNRHNPFYPRFWEDRLEELPLRLVVPWRKERGIFVCDMSDLFGIGVPEEWTREVLMRIKCHDYNRFYLLTKQPQNLIKFSPFPKNCWVGVTPPSYYNMFRALNKLREIEATVKYLSFEPLLESMAGPRLMLEGINWVIIGAQTKPYKPPKIEWVQEIVEACDKAGIPVFLKDNLRPIIAERQKPFWYIDHFESHLKQELPKGK